MRANDETTATQLHELLMHNGISMCLRTVLRSREQLGLTFRGSAYFSTHPKRKQGEKTALGSTASK